MSDGCQNSDPGQRDFKPRVPLKPAIVEATRTRALIAEQREAWDRQRQALAQTIREEFPVGTKVRWMHGSNYIEGVVVDTARYDWSDDVTVRNSKSGKDFRKEAKDLELLI
jgi:surface antigen